MSLILWVGFILFVIGMLAFDLGILRKDARVISSSEALRFSALCMALALGFTAVVYWIYEHRLFGDAAPHLSGSEAAMQFFTGWVVEQSLSIDNIFVIAVIFGYFRIPLQFQHRVLFWGILGALIMRGVMIAFGAALIARFAWINYLFGALLFYAAIKLFRSHEDSFDPHSNWFYRIATRLYPVSKNLDGERFFTIENGKRVMTPLFLVLLVIESTDLLFALDSIPAVFAITQDPFLVFTSNVFAILNLRSLYFALAALMTRFAYLKTALVAVLMFIGAKMLLHGVFHMPTWVSMLVIVGAIAMGIGASWVLPGRKVQGALGEK